MHFFNTIFKHLCCTDNLIVEKSLKTGFCCCSFYCPPIPSHSDFPWFVTKKFHSRLVEKLTSWMQRLRKCLQFLYWAVQPRRVLFILEKMFTLIYSTVYLNTLCTKSTSWLRSSDIKQSEFTNNSFLASVSSLWYVIIGWRVHCCWFQW